MSQEEHRISPAEVEQSEMQSVAAEFEQATLLDRIREGITMRRLVASASVITIGFAGYKVAQYEYQTHHVVPDHTLALPSSEVPNILTPSPSTPAQSTPNSPAISHTPEKKKSAIPELAPKAPTRIMIPKLHIDTAVLPVASTPTGKKNPWGGDIYNEVDFPVDNGEQKARYWVQQGEPNTLKDITFAQNPQAVMRTIIYGHASDIGNHLLFQDLQKLKMGDTFTLVASDYEFTYTVYSLSNPAKNGLADDSHVYNVPKDGRKEAALIACLPDSASHSVRIGYLSAVKRMPSK